ncbi:ParA family protein [Synechococcus elongatus]|uniref:ParA family protein n=1 Tax=Synechococcus elongatus TaxID=32046 RepID=UPI000F7F46A1|nr:ParA family protein [Synechococcus elongatus]
MSIILCTQHKGGVGKTTLSVHLAGVLSSRLGRVLLIDCDTQGNSWHFYFKERVTKHLSIKDYNSRLSLLWNPKRSQIKKVADLQTYDHILLDMTTPLPETVKTILDNNPDKIYIPVTKHPFALNGLIDTVVAISKLEKMFQYSPKVVIVPLGSYKNTIDTKIQDNIASLPSKYTMAGRMKDLNREFNQALKDGQFIWNYDGQEELKQYFNNLLSL